MLTISKYFWLNSIEKDLKYLYFKNQSVSPFLEYNYFKRVVKLSYYYRIISRCYVCYYVVRKDNKPILIAPILHYMNGENELFGKYNGYNYSDFIYDKSIFLNEAWELLISKLKRINIYKFKANSFISELHNIKHQQIVNVKIPFGRNYKTYLLGLSKSVRQNLRTAYNKLIKGNHHFELININGGGKYASIHFDEIINIYCSRHVNRYGLKYSII